MTPDEIARLRALMARANPCNNGWLCNFRTTEDGPPDPEGPAAEAGPFDVWHTGGPGGQVALFDQREVAELFVAAVHALPALLDEVCRLRAKLLDAAANAYDVGREDERIYQQNRRQAGE